MIWLTAGRIQVSLIDFKVEQSTKNYYRSTLKSGHRPSCHKGGALTLGRVLITERCHEDIFSPFSSRSPFRTWIDWNLVADRILCFFSSKCSLRANELIAKHCTTILSIVFLRKPPAHQNRRRQATFCEIYETFLDIIILEPSFQSRVLFWLVSSQASPRALDKITHTFADNP